MRLLISRGRGRRVQADTVLSFKTASGLWVRSDGEGFSITDQSAAVEGTTGVKIFNPHRGRKKQARAFQKWAKTNLQKLNKMSFSQVLGALKRAGISYVKA
jgi:hypothetical protein